MNNDDNLWDKLIISSFFILEYRGTTKTGIDEKMDI
jgi:hypothetical protein